MTVLDQNTQRTPEWKPSAEEQEYLRLVMNKFDIARQARKQKYKILNDRTLEEYWNDSESRWLSHIPDKRRKSWQSNIVKPITRNKCIGIIANLLDQFIEPDITAELDGEIVAEVAETLRDLIDHADQKDRYALKMLLLLIETVSKGTAFLEEGYIMELRKIKDIIKWDPLTGDVEFEPKEILDYEGFRSTVIDPREIYLGNVFEFDMQKQPYVFRRQVLSYQDAETRYGQMSNWKYVAPGIPQRIGEDEGDFYEPQIVSDLEANDVEVLTFYSKFDDEVASIIQGIPMTKPHTPIPYTHKKYPYVKSVFEIMSSRFAYGKSLPDKLQGEQDTINTLYRMMIDKGFLSIFPPLLAKGFAKITTDIIAPGKVTSIGSEADIVVPTGVAGGVGNELQLLALIERSMDASSIDPQHLGTPASGERSATQTMEAKEGAQKILGLFGFMIAFAIEDMVDLRIQNILQFWAKQERLVLKDGQRKTIKNIFQIKNRELRNGSIGTREISFLPTNQQPSSGEIRMEEFQLRKKGKNIEKIILDPDIIRNYNIMVRVQANPSDRMSPQLRKALGIEFYDRFIKEPLVNREELVKDTMKLWDKDVTKMMKTKEQVQAEQKKAQAEAMQGQTQGAGKPGTQTKGNITSQLAAAAQPNLQDMINA